MDIKKLQKQIMEKKHLKKKKLNEEISEQIMELSGLIDEEGATILLAKKYGINIGNKTENKHKKFLDKWKGKLQIIVDNPQIRRLKTQSVINADGTYRNLKFAPKDLENIREDKIKTGAPYECYIFILSIKERFNAQFGAFKSITFLIWDEKSNMPRAYSCIPPQFIAQELDNNSYNTIYHIEYEGLKQSQTNENRSYHFGKITRIGKINKLVQSSL